MDPLDERVRQFWRNELTNARHKVVQAVFIANNAVRRARLGMPIDEPPPLHSPWSPLISDVKRMEMLNDPHRAANANTEEPGA